MTGGLTVGYLQTMGTHGRSVVGQVHSFIIHCVSSVCGSGYKVLDKEVC